MKSYINRIVCFYKSIRSRLIISIAFTAVVASLLIGVLSIEFSTSSINDEANQKLSYMARSYANYLERHFSEVTKTVDILEYGVLQGIDETKIHEDEYLEAIVDNMDELVRIQAQNSTQGKTAYIYFNPELTGRVHDIYYADQDGDNVVDKQKPVPIEFYTSNNDTTEDKSWWFGPVSSGKEHWSNPYNWELDNGTITEFVSYTRPVYIGKELLCVIGSDFTYENIREIINNIKIYNSGYSFLVDNNYNIITHPLYKGYENLGDINNGQFKKIIEESGEKNSKVVQYDSYGKGKKVAALARMNNGWIVGMTADESEILSGILELRKLLYLLILLLCVGSILLSMPLGNMISKPIVAISNIVRDIGGANYSVKIPEKYLMRKDEIGTLSNSIVNMSRKITDDIEEINHQNHILKYDTLTNAVNKDYLKQLVNQYIKDNEEVKETNYTAAMVIINVDNFRVINETMSFDTGNQLLYEIAKRIFLNINNTDILARTDGDEFTIFFKKLEDNNDVIEKIEMIFSLFNEPFKVFSEEIFISISAGISLFPTDGRYYEELFKNASSAINHIKLNKKNGYEFYQRNINKMTTEKYEIINNLRYALIRNEFELYYQPQIDIQNNRLVGMEALLRWNSPNGNIPPNKFIPLAEETSLIVPIGEWVIEEACRMGVKLKELGYPIIVGVNISAIQFKEAYLVELIEKILYETGLQASFLDVEITESILMDNSITTSRILKELKEIGVGLSIDDFGTGYSSLSYLKNYVVDRLKIDRSFIRDIPQNDDGTIAKAIINLTKSLGIKSIAEGIEEKEQEEFLLKNGCDEVQGYYYCKPIPEEKLIEYIKGFYN